MVKKRIVVPVIALALLRKQSRKASRGKRRIWMKEWLKKRNAQGAYHQLMKELSTIDVSGYRNFVRMDSSTFELLHNMVAPIIQRQNTVMRESISPGERIAITLRFLATGETYESLKFLYRVAAQTLGKIIPETCCAIADVLKGEYLKVPKTEAEWKKVAQAFQEKWNIHNCLGAMDGKHIMIQPPSNTGSYYFNYKQRFSIVLLAIVDANYNFTYIDVGCNGRISDGGVFKNSNLFRALEENSLNMPKMDILPFTEINFPYFIVADEAFPLKEYILKPYSQRGLTLERIFNYRLSRARRVVENAFGILSNRFRIFMTPINLIPEKVEIITFACCSLHNFLRSRKEACPIYMPPGSVDTENPITHIFEQGNWHQGPIPTGFAPLKNQSGNMHAKSAKDNRNILSAYFSSKDGEVPWQWSVV